MMRTICVTISWVYSKFINFSNNSSNVISRANTISSGIIIFYI